MRIRDVFVVTMCCIACACHIDPPSGGKQTPDDAIGAGATARRTSQTGGGEADGGRARSSAFPSPQTDLFADNPVATALNMAHSWDGRIFTKKGGDGRYHFVVLRPERVGRRDNGQPYFGPDAFSASGTLSEQEANMPQPAGVNFPFSFPIMAPWPKTQGENPYPSDAEGNLEENGDYLGYDIFLVTQVTSPSRMGFLRARIVVDKPYTADATIAGVTVVEPFGYMYAADGSHLYAIEPTITHDGHLMVFQGNPVNTGTDVQPPLTIDRIMYTYNADPSNANGWSTPKQLSRLYHEDRDVTVAGKTLAERYPIARQPLRDVDGRVFAAEDQYYGAYPWISPEGTELFHTALNARRTSGARRTGYSVVGRWTGYMQRHIDGPPNWSLEGNGGAQLPWEILMTFAFGATSSIWNPFNERLDPPVPYLPARPVYAMYSLAFQQYFEVSLADFVDGDYALVWSLNELATRDEDDWPRADLRRTPDTSGNLQHGALIGGAMFPIEYNDLDVRVGIRGQAVHFERDGAVVAEPSDWDLSRGTTVELWVKPRVTLLEGQYLSLAVKPGVFSLYLGPGNRIYASVTRPSGKVEVDGLGPGAPAGTWSHVALTYRAETGVVRVYHNGAILHERRVAPEALDRARSRFVAGPGYAGYVSTVNAAGLVIDLDEVKVSRVARGPAEVRDAAFVRGTAAPEDAYPLELPLGLEASRMRQGVAGGPRTAEVALGKQLFFDPRLSMDRSTSCASCHQAQLSTTDGLAQASGLFGATLSRNTPPIFNRLFSDKQMWDGAAASRSTQSSLPLFNPLEMGYQAHRLTDLIRFVPGYSEQFSAVYQTEADVAHVERALGAYMTSVVSGGSPVDNFRGGDTSALSPAAQRGLKLFFGKARCAGCHSGGNYSDEQFHRSILGSAVTDAGRGTVTGRAVDQQTFKTPTLRNIAQTAPYFHAGQVQTLAEVIERYNQGSDEPQLRDPELHPLNLTNSEQADLLGFLQGLTAPISNTDAPESLPVAPEFTCPESATLFQGNYGTACPGYTCWAWKTDTEISGPLVDASPYGYPLWNVQCPVGGTQLSASEPTCPEGMQRFDEDYGTGCGSSSCWRDKYAADLLGVSVADAASFGYPDWVVQCPVGWPQLPAQCPAGLSPQAGSYGTGCGALTCWVRKNQAAGLAELADATPFGYPDWYVRCPLGTPLPQ